VDERNFKREKSFIDTFLEGSHIARLATTDRDGKPHVVPVWYAWDGEKIWINSCPVPEKLRIWK